MTLPKEVSEAIVAYTLAVGETSGRPFNAQAWIYRVEKGAALESALLSALSAAREGALREAAAELHPLRVTFDGPMPRDHAEIREAFRLAMAHMAERILALASRPEPAKRREASPGEIEAWASRLAEDLAVAPESYKAEPAPEPTPDSEGLPCPVCDDGIEGPCPRCEPAEPAPPAAACPKCGSEHHMTIETLPPLEVCQRCSTAWPDQSTAKGA